MQLRNKVMSAEFFEEPFLFGNDIGTALRERYVTKIHFCLFESKSVSKSPRLFQVIRQGNTS